MRDGPGLWGFAQAESEAGKSGEATCVAGVAHFTSDPHSPFSAVMAFAFWVMKMF